MKSVSIKWPAAMLFVTLTSSVVSPCLAQSERADERTDVLECAKNFEQAQLLRNDAKYLAATDEALKCSQPKCGQALLTECSRMYTDLQQATPSVVISANDQAGNEVSKARVVIDGTLTLDQPDGKPVNLDPGTHEFAFDAPGFSAVTRRITLLAGEKFRPVSVSFNAAPTLSEPAHGAPTPPAPTRDNPALAPRRVPTMSYVLGGVSLAAALGFVTFRASGANKYDDLKQGCSPNCSASEVDNLKQRYNLSYVALGVSAAALAGAVGFYLLQPRTPHDVASALFVQPAPNGASAQLVTRF